MYCSSCGMAVSQRLTYCNHCGAKLNRGESMVKSSQPRPESLIWGMVATFFFGLVGTTMLIGMMKAVLGMYVGQILPFAMLIFLIMLLLEGVFIRLLLRRPRGIAEGREGRLSEATLSREQVTNELDAAQQRVLAEPVPSVTEHTTRTFDPVYTERK